MVCKRFALRLGHGPGLAVWSPSAALDLALLVSDLKYRLLAQGNL